MDSVESASKLYSILSSLEGSNKESIDDLLKDSAEKTTVRAVKKLNKDFITNSYGKEGLERYLRSILDYWEGYTGFKPKKVAHLAKKVFYNILMSPAKLVAKAYDYMIEKTNSHLLSTMSIGAVGGELAELLSLFGETAYYSSTLKLSFMNVLQGQLMYNGYMLLEVPIITSLISMLGTAFIIGGTSAVFNHKKLELEEIEKDIRNYSKDFKDTFKKYNEAFFQSRITPSLTNLNAIYMLSSTKAYKGAMNSEEGLREYEKLMLPYISKVLKKSIAPNLVLHHSPRGVGGFTLVYNSLIGKFIKKKSYSPVFLNTDRFNAVPEYLFALFHEISHGAGATSEQMASYYAEKALESVQEDFPLEGYDLFLSVNRLESAVSTLSMKFDSSEDFLSELDKLKLPKFIKESFGYSFNPSFSIAFPVGEALYGTKIESKFSGLYSSGPYIAKKLVEKGEIKTF
jgi:hypothetical protein